MPRHPHRHCVIHDITLPTTPVYLTTTTQPTTTLPTIPSLHPHHPSVITNPKRCADVSAHFQSMCKGKNSDIGTWLYHIITHTDISSLPPPLRCPPTSTNNPLIITTIYSSSSSKAITSSSAFPSPLRHTHPPNSHRSGIPPPTPPPGSRLTPRSRTKSRSPGPQRLGSDTINQTISLCNYSIGRCLTWLGLPWRRRRRRGRRRWR